MSDQFREYSGVLHIHTAYSDGFGDMPYIIRCAKDAGLDFAIVSDHNTLDALDDGWQRWHDSLLLVIGVEVSSIYGHALVLGLDHCPWWRYVHPSEYLPAIERMGGTSFIAHPAHRSRWKFRHAKHAWPNLHSESYAGLEIWAYMHDWVHWAYPFHPIKGIRHPGSKIHGPHPPLLREWDEIAQRRHVAGIGSLDAHEFHFPIRKLRPALFRMLPMDYLFRTVRTHVLMPEHTGDAARDAATLTQALAKGRCFVEYLPAGDATGTRFTARRGDELALMGDELWLGGIRQAHAALSLSKGGELEFKATLPQDADITLVWNSQPIAHATGRQLIHHDSRPGVYRIEARRNGLPWVFTNHIYVR